MKRRLIALIVAELFVASPGALAAEGINWSGSVGLGLRNTDANAKDSSKLNEYRDLDSGAFGLFDARARGDNYYFNGFGENIGRDDWYVDLWGGQYDTFKYQLYGNALRHNFGSGPGAVSPFGGIGSSTLTATFRTGAGTGASPFVFPATNTSTWIPFDNSYERQDVGGMFEISKGSPWYLRFDGNQVKRDGIKVLAGAQGTSPGNGFIELPSPVDFVANNVSVEGGYQTKEQQYALSYTYSKFSNDNQLLSWSNGFFSPANPLLRDTTVLPPDNEFWRIGANATWKKLPYESTLAGRLTYSKVTNDVPVLQTMLAPNTAVAGTPAGVGSFPSTGANSPLFHGETVNKTLSVSLTSHPDPKADTRLYWNWSQKENNSTQMVFSPTAASTLQCSGVACVPELFSYRKNNLGLEGSYRVNRENKLTAGYDYLYTWRERVDFDETTDQKFYAEWKNSSLDMLSARIKYQYLDRNSNYVGSTDPTVIDSFVRRFDLANVNQNLVKLVLDANPAPMWDVGFEAIYKNNDFKDTILGRKDDQRQEYYANVGYGDAKRFRVMVFGDIEFLEYNSLHRVGSGNANPSAPPAPAAPAISTTYDWSAKNKDKSWQVGLGADWVPAERWKLSGSFIYAETNGTTDFVTQAGTILAAPLLPINNSDNTKRTAFVLKGTYKAAKNWEFTGGYSFERYWFSDIGYDGFGNLVGSGTPTTANNTATSYLTGQSAYQSYNANIFYVISTYKF